MNLIKINTFQNPSLSYHKFYKALPGNMIFQIKAASQHLCLFRTHEDISFPELIKFTNKHS